MVKGVFFAGTVAILLFAFPLFEKQWQSFVLVRCQLIYCFMTSTWRLFTLPARLRNGMYFVRTHSSTILRTLLQYCIYCTGTVRRVYYEVVKKARHIIR